MENSKNTDLEANLPEYDQLSDADLEKALRVKILPNEEEKQLEIENDLYFDRTKSLWNTRSFIYGTVLGDGYINQNGALTLQHGCEQKSYLAWKYSMLKYWDYLVSTSEIKRVLNYQNKAGKIYVSFRFNTKSILKQERTDFYKFNGKKFQKQLPLNFYEALDDQFLAIWFMDDGAKWGTTSALDISSFTPSEQIIIQEALTEKFNLETSISNHTQKNNVKLYFKASTYGDFIDAVKPYLLPSLMYKLKL